MNVIPKKYYLDEILDDFIGNKRKDFMRCDIYEVDNIYNIEIDLPGFAKSEVNIEFKKDYLIVKAKKEINDENNKNYIRRERVSGEYYRSFYLGDIDASNISARFNNGILKIIVPKSEKQDDKKIIQIMD